MRMVVLGRDGVINRTPTRTSVRTPDDWHALPGSLRAIARLTFARFHVVVITNQPELGEGSLDSGTLARIHAKMHSEVAREGGRIDAVFYCPHHPAEECACRLPKPGLLLDLKQRLGIDLRGAPFISSNLDDLQAARSLRMRSILLCSRHDNESKTRVPEGVEVFQDLASAVEALPGQSG